jgi:hypothetical protein
MIGREKEYSKLSQKFLVRQNIMDWEEFLKHPEVVHVDKSRSTLPGKYLFGKVLHDILECLNMYLACSELALTQPNIPSNVVEWLSKWNPTIRNWISDITDFWQEFETLNSKADWPILIEEIGKVPNEATVIASEAQNLSLPSDPKHRFIINAAIQNIVRLNLIVSHIQQQEYLPLWKND